MSVSAKLELDSVSKSFQNRVAVDRITCAFQTNQTCALIGPSGCGKSTILRMLIGLIQPDSGRVLIEGQPVATLAASQRRACFGYVIQSGGLFPHLSARQNVQLPGLVSGKEQTAIQQRVDLLCELTKFPREGLDKYPAQLSGGQQQRVSLMRALLSDPEVLLLDEPLGALDPMIRSQLQTDLKTIFDQLGKTVVLVTHDLNEAAWFGHEIMLLREGRLVQRGPLGELLQHPKHPFVEEFVQAQSANATLHDSLSGERRQ